MSPLHAVLDEYLAMRRAFGHELCLAGHLLKQLVAFADRAGATYVTTDLIGVGDPTRAARRMGPALRDRASLRSALAHGPPYRHLLPPSVSASAAHIYRDEEITH
jgi:hypothetical protein